MSKVFKNEPIGKVFSSEISSITIRTNSIKTIEQNQEDLQIGKFLKIRAGNSSFVIAIIQNIKMVDNCDLGNCRFEIICQPIGTLVDLDFKRGVDFLPLPSEDVFVIDIDSLKLIFDNDEEFNFLLGKLSQNKDIDFKVDGNKFFGKHIAIMGSTGSGKSCVVSKILQEVIGIEKAENKNREDQKNSHIVIFDIHSEYKSAFTLEEQQKFNLNVLEIDQLKLPYWLMNAEELENIFIESNEQNSHNQVSQFKNAVVMNKKRHNKHLEKINYDTPVYFDINEIYYYIENLNREMIGKAIDEKKLLPPENSPKLLNGTLIQKREDYYFEKIYDFVPQSSAKADKATGGPYNGDFDRFVSRLETKLADERLNFFLKPTKKDGTPYITEDFEDIVKQFIGYINQSNVTIIDLSGIPFEVLSITISLISRLIFDFCFHYSKIKHEQDLLNDVPVMLVCEEAHNYIPRSNDVQYKASKKSLERIAKEGRKYGLSLMIVSQRPSEVSDTILSQCNNFVALRLTNLNDQNYIKNLLPDCIGTICDILPNLKPGEGLIVGDASLMPAIVQFELPVPEPKSQTVKFLEEWQEPWSELTFFNIIKRWRKEQ